MEGQGFRDRTPEYETAGATILGISFDTPEENKQFAEAQGFPYKLLADTSRSMGDVYGVKRAATEKFPDFPMRKTFLIDPEGIVRKVYDVTDTAGHPAEVLADINALR